MRGGVCSLAFLALGLAALTSSPRQVQVTVRTLPGNVEGSRELLPKKAFAPGEAPWVVLPLGTPLTRNPVPNQDLVTITTLNKIPASLREDSTLPVSHELRLLPEINSRTTITVAVTYIRREKGKLVDQPTTAKVRLPKGQMLLVAPEGADVYAISAEEVGTASRANAPGDL